MYQYLYIAVYLYLSSVVVSVVVSVVICSCCELFSNSMFLFFLVYSCISNICVIANSNCYERASFYFRRISRVGLSYSHF